MSSRKTLPGGRENGYGSAVGISNSSPGGLLLAADRVPPMARDNYSAIKPCSHIKSVLDSKAKETVFLTYRQAVNISKVSTSPEYYYTQRKDGSIVPTTKLIDLKSESLHCTDCSLNNFQHTFICLQCPHVGCFNNTVNHSYQHFKQNLHFFGIDSHFGLLYCFMCGDYINDPRLETIRQSLQNLNQNEKINGQHHNGVVSDPIVLSNYTSPSERATTGLKGFVNLGSTCFMSCILQTFIHNPIMRNQFFNNDLHFFNCESSPEYHYPGGSIEESTACVTCSIDNIFKNFYGQTDIQGFGMTNLLTTAWFKKKLLAGFQEQDAHEFWQFILDELHMDHKRITSISQNGSGPVSAEKRSPSTDSETEHSSCPCITHSTFSGELESSIRCLSCDSVTNTIDPTVDLSLEISKSKKKSSSTLTIYDCLDLFTKEENLDTMYNCQYCGDRSEAVKSLKVKKLPKVLAIQLKRFEHNLMSDTSLKIEIPVKIPLFLDLTKYTSSASLTDETDGGKVYELFAMVCHVGSVNTGHYIAIVKNGDGQWFRFDDSVITLVTTEEVMNTNAYLLFYITHKI